MQAMKLYTRPISTAVYGPWRSLGEVIMNHKLRSSSLMVSLLILAPSAFALTVPPANGMSYVLSGGTLERTVRNDTVTEYIMDTGLAGADSPICTASGQSAPGQPCHILIEKVVVWSLTTLKGSARGTVSVVANRNFPDLHIDLPVRVASYNFLEDQDFTSILQTGKGSITGSLFIRETQPVRYSGAIFFPIGCGVFSFCYADGTQVNIDNSDFLEPPFKLVFTFD
jgi:hypothetical protein